LLINTVLPELHLVGLLYIIKALILSKHRYSTKFNNSVQLRLSFRDFPKKFNLGVFDEVAF